MNILYFGITPWHTIRQRPQQIAELLSKRHNILYVNPIVDPLFIAFYKVWNRSYARNFIPLVQVEERSPSLRILSPPSLVPGISFVGALNDRLVYLLSKWLLDYSHTHGMEPDVLWLSHPMQAKALEVLGADSLICYDCMDDYPNLEMPSRSSYYSSRERVILKRADVVFATSLVLEAKCRIYSSNVVRVPNGVEVDHFRPRKLEGSNLERGRHPVIGFFGYLGSWIDVDLIMHLATMRKDWTFKLIGPLGNSKCQRLGSLTNVELLGEQPYESLPRLIEEFTVCIIPFRTGELMHSVNPVKVYEYLATGKPIVSSDLLEVRQFAPYVRIANDRGHFLALLDDAVDEIDSNLQMSRMKLAQNNSWSERVRAIETALERVYTRTN